MFEYVGSIAFNSTYKCFCSDEVFDACSKDSFNKLLKFIQAITARKDKNKTLEDLVREHQEIPVTKTEPDSCPLDGTELQEAPLQDKAKKATEQEGLQKE